MTPLRSILLFFFTAIVWALCGCTTHSGKELSAAETIIDEMPDSAYKILMALDSTHLHGNGDKAKFALLQTQALVKMDSLISDVSHIDYARKYFAESGSDTDRMKTEFYYAWVNFSNNEVYQAMYSAIKAYDIAKKLNNDYWIAKTAELISFIFFSDYNLTESEKYTKTAIDYYQKCDRECNAKFCKIDLATVFYGQNKFHETLDVLSDFKSPRTADDSTLLAVADRMKLHAWFNIGEYNKADSVFHEMLTLQEYNPIDALSYHLKILLLCRNHEFDQIPEYTTLGYAAVSDSADLSAMTRARMNTAASQDDYKTAYIIADSMIRLNDMIARRALQAQSSIAQRDYYNERMEQQRLKAERRKYMIIGISLLAILTAAFYIIFYRLRMKIKDLEIQAKSSDILLLSKIIETQASDSLLLRESIETKNSEIQSLNDRLDMESGNYKKEEIKQRKLMTAFADSWKTIGNFCREIRDCDRSNASEINKSLKLLDSIISDLGKEKNIKIIEQLVNMFHNNLMKKARKDMPELDADDFRLLCLLYFGMDSHVIATILGIKRNSLGPTKTRLIKKIRACKSPDCSRYADLLD